MIVYQLGCHHGHQFEAWFRDSATYDEQSAAGVIECPYCGDSRVVKTLTAPHLAKGLDRPEAAETRARVVAEQILRTVGRLRQNVEGNFKYVGDKFAEEARRIHYGETDERGIYGEATNEETSDLDDEGIEYYRLPTPPRRDD